MKRYPVFIIIIFCLGFFSIPTSLQAFGVAQIDQAKVRIMIPPGAAKTGSINVDNPTSEAKFIKAYLEDWAYLPLCDGTKDFKSAGTTGLSAASWISFSPSEFTIPPFGRQVLNYSVKVPNNAQGGHYAVMFFENYMGDPNKVAEGQVNVNVTIRVASLFYIESEGTVRREAKISNFEVKNSKDGVLEISAKLDNIGNVDITTKSTFFILDKKGVVQARGEFNDAYTFPGDSVILTSSWKEPIPAGSYDLVLSVDLGRALEELELGRGPVITKEARLIIGADGNVTNVGALK